MSKRELEIQLTSSQNTSLTNEAAIGSLFKELFRPFSDNFFQLSYEIQREFKTSGSPEVTRMDFDRIHFDKESGQGKFRVVLDINFSFGCEDQKTEKEDQTSEWTFTLDKKSATLIFHSSPFAESRSTADEF